MEKSGYIITMNRQYGAGGREIGQMLADRLQIRYLDKELLRMVSDQSGIEESFFHVADERPGENLIYRMVKSKTPKTGKPSTSGNMLTDENLFRFQKEAIQKVAESGESCVIVGRCADFILKEYPNLFSIFIYADPESRVERIVRRTSYNQDEARKNMKRIDKERKDYYHYYTGSTWGDMSNYDLCLDSGKLGAENSVSLIIEYLKMRGII